MGIKTRVNSAGHLEGYDPETLDVVWIEKKKLKGRDGRRMSQIRGVGSKNLSPIERVMVGGKKVYVQKGVNPDEIPVKIHPFSRTMADNILEKVMEGYSIQEIGRMDGFYSAKIIHSWKHKYPDFKKELLMAEELQSDLYRDRIKELINQTDEMNYSAQNVKINHLKWLCEMADPMKYSKKTTVQGNPDQPIQIVVTTGVPDPLPHQRPPELGLDGKIIQEVIETTGEEIGE